MMRRPPQIWNGNLVVKSETEQSLAKRGTGHRRKGGIEIHIVIQAVFPQNIVEVLGVNIVWIGFQPCVEREQGQNRANAGEECSKRDLLKPRLPISGIHCEENSFLT